MLHVVDRRRACQRSRSSNSPRADAAGEVEYYEMPAHNFGLVPAAVNFTGKQGLPPRHLQQRRSVPNRVVPLIRLPPHERL